MTETHYIIENIKYNIEVHIRCGIKYDLYDIIIERIDSYLKDYTARGLKEVLDHYNMDIYDAMELYKEEYGEIEAKDKEQFYAMLCFIVIKNPTIMP